VANKATSELYRALQLLRVLHVYVEAFERIWTL